MPNSPSQGLGWLDAWKPSPSIADRNVARGAETCLEERADLVRVDFRPRALEIGTPAGVAARQVGSHCR